MHRSFIVHYDRNLLPSILFLIAMFTIRPSHFGEDVNLIGIIILILSLPTIPNLKNEFSPLNNVAIKSVALIVLWSFIAMHAMINNVDAIFPIYGCVTAIAVAVYMITQSSFINVARNCIYLFIATLSILGYSGIITSIASLTIGNDNIHIFSIPNHTYGDTGDVFIPLTMVYNIKTYSWGEFPRMSFFWRESGIAQAVYAWALSAVLFSPQLTYRKLLVFGLLAGGILTQSTLAYGNIAFVISAWKLSTKRTNALLYLITTSVIIGLCAVLFNISMYNEDIGFTSKEGGESYLDRYYAAQRGYEMLLQNPFGAGMYSRSSVANGGINLIGSLGEIGIIGTALTLAVYAISILNTSRPFATAIGVMPILFTAITSQPLLDSFGIWILVLTDPSILHDEILGSGARSTAPRGLVGELPTVK